ncbi:hypothetical protein AVEN_161047-1, partial [Araneus ventricosus]
FFVLNSRFQYQK